MRKILNYNYNEYILRRVKVFGMLCDCEFAKWSFYAPGIIEKTKTDFQNYEGGGASLEYSDSPTYAIPRDQEKPH